MSNNMGVHYSSAKHDWGTPVALFREWDEKFGFTLDVCAHKDNHKCDRYFSEEEDGLKQDWSGDVCWMNPPYGRAISAWIKKAWEESQRGATVVCLIPSRTDTSYWHDYVMKGEIVFLRGRIKFIDSNSQDNPAPAPFPSAIVIFGGKPKSEMSKEIEELHLLKKELTQCRAKMDEEIKELNHRIDCTQKWTQENFLMDGALREVNHRIDLTQSMIDFTNPTP